MLVVLDSRNLVALGRMEDSFRSAGWSWHSELTLLAQCPHDLAGKWFLDFSHFPHISLKSYADIKHLIAHIRP